MATRRISVSVIPRVSRTEVLGPSEDGSYKVRVTSAPTDGKANEAVIVALSEFFDVAKSSVRIVRGLTGRKKIIEINRD